MTEVEPVPLGLSERQAAVLDSLMTTGCVNESAAELGMRREALGMHLVRACRKVGVRNRTLLLLRWADERRAGDALREVL